MIPNAAARARTAHPPWFTSSRCAALLLVDDDAAELLPYKMVQLSR
jgi:hypothetical protein